ncbi:MAG: sigma-70 family RNA polymerase sigma factor [Chitinophagaceae bacterium]|nr:sigma-70 family RNA polymerase sigma factor [Chitinophagaceae bacterium]
MRIARGDGEAMRCIFDLYYSRLRFYALSIIENEEDARDLAQDALLQLWNNRTQLAGQQAENLAAWLFTIIRRDCLDYLKHQKVKNNKQDQIASLVPLVGQPADAGIILTEVLSLIYAEIDRLPPALAEILRLSYLEELPTATIAEKLNTTPNNIRVQRSRAVEKLRNALLKRHLEAPVIFSIIFSEIFRTRL